jgi:alpha-beta hydrolase superfamily lysophospholipase
MSNENIISESDGRRILTGDFSSSTNLEKIYYKRTEPLQKEEGPSIHLFIIHDFCDYHGRYLDVCDYFVKKFKGNITITLMDLKGHGLSTGTRSHVNEFSSYCFDFAKVINIGLAHSGSESKAVVIGAGLGALVTLKLDQVHYSQLSRPISAIILSNPMIKINIELPKWAELLLLADHPSIHKMKFPKRFLGEDLTSCGVMARSFNSDPLNSHYITFGMYKEMLEAGSIIRTSSYFVDIPNLLLVGESDGYCDVETTQLFQRGMPKTTSELIKYPGLKHDLFHETGRDKVLEDVYNWISTTFKELP